MDTGGRVRPSICKVLVSIFTGRRVRRSLLPAARQHSEHVRTGVVTVAPVVTTHRRRQGILVYSHYYAKDTPWNHQQATNVACVALFAIVGTALRSMCGELAVSQGLTPNSASLMPSNQKGSQSPPAVHPGPVFFRDLLANCLGSLLMGTAVGLSPYALPRFPNLYVGFTTGLCGCLTTFSGWNSAAASILATGAFARAALCLSLGLASAGASLCLGLLIGSRILRTHPRGRAAAAAATAEAAQRARSARDGRCSGPAVRAASSAHRAACPTVMLPVRSSLEMASTPHGKPKPLVQSGAAAGGASVECNVVGAAQPPPWADRGLSAAEVPIEELDEQEEAVLGSVGQLETSAQPHRHAAQLRLEQAASPAPCGSQTRTWRQWRGRSLDPVATPSAPRVARSETAFPLYNTWKLLVSIIALALALSGCAAAAAVAALNDTRSLTLPVGLLLSPPFAVLRYALSFHNRRHPRLPAYTLLCNAGGALLSGVSAALVLHLRSVADDGVGEGPGTRAQADSASEPGAAVHALLGAVSLGAAGSLSTVSSFVNELRLLSPAHAAQYALATIAVGQSVAAAVNYGFQFVVGAS